LQLSDVHESLLHVLVGHVLLHVSGVLHVSGLTQPSMLQLFCPPQELETTQTLLPPGQLAPHQFQEEQTLFALHVFSAEAPLPLQVLLNVQVSDVHVFSLLHVFVPHVSIPHVLPLGQVWTPWVLVVRQSALTDRGTAKPPRRMPPPTSDFVTLLMKSRLVDAPAALVVPCVNAPSYSFMLPCLSLLLAIKGLVVLAARPRHNPGPHSSSSALSV